MGILEDMLNKLDEILKEVTYNRQEIKKIQLVQSFPHHLALTIESLLKLPNYAGTALEISCLTNRARAVESGYLNQLNLMDVVSKEKIGRKALFRLKNEWVDPQKG